MSDLIEVLTIWAQAYPVEVFPEMTPDEWKKADIVLRNNGLSLTRISASNMRHVVTNLAEFIPADQREG